MKEDDNPFKSYEGKYCKVVYVDRQQERAIKGHVYCKNGKLVLIRTDVNEVTLHIDIIRRIQNI